MTVKILKSSIAAFRDFEVQVAAHAAEMKNWRAHMARVKSDDASGVTGIERHWPLVRPAAHPLIESAVNEKDEVDFELVDDGPTPEQILRQKKDQILHEICRLEQSAIADIVPVGKRRLMNLQENSILTAHAARVSENTDGIIKAAASALGLRQAPAMPTDDAKFVAEQSERRRKIVSIEAAAAQAMNDIEDLTLDNIDAWTMPKFPD
jgi:hypothetical protein